MGHRARHGTDEQDARTGHSVPPSPGGLVLDEEHILGRCFSRTVTASPGFSPCVANRSSRWASGGVHLLVAHDVHCGAHSLCWMASRGRPYRRLRAVGSMPVGSPQLAKFADYIAKTG